MKERAPGAMGLFAETLAQQKAKGLASGKARLEKVFDDEPTREKPVSASVVSEPVAPAAPAEETPEQSKVKPGAERVHLLDPAKITPWDLADRPDDELGDLESLTESIRMHGQEVPILVRPTDKRGHYELIYGRRRWTVCQDLGVKVKAFIREVDDKSAYELMYLENSDRQELSSWARAISYRKAIDKGIYPTESALAAHLGISRSTMSNIMVYNRLPKEVTEAIGSMSKVSILTAKAILSASQDSENIPALVDAADRIRNADLCGDKVLSYVGRARREPSEGLKVATDGDGRKLFSYRHTGRGGYELHFSKEAAKRKDLDQIVDYLNELFGK